MGAGYAKRFSLALPSGNKVRVKRVSLLSQVRMGQIPPHLISAVWAVFGRDDGNTATVSPDTDTRVKTMIDLLDQAIKAVLIDVVIVYDDEPTATTDDADGFLTGRVNVKDMPDGDKALLFGFAQGVVQADPLEQEVRQDLERFPAQQPGEAAGSGGETVRAAAKSDDPAQPAVAAGAGV